jgi:hypothetical protein
MDPITLATITASLTVLGTEVAKGAANEAGKNLWGKVKQVLGFTTNPPEKELARSVAEKLTQLPDDILKDLLGQIKESDTTSGLLVGQIEAESVVVANRIDIQGGFHMGGGSK